MAGSRENGWTVLALYGQKGTAACMTFSRRRNAPDRL
jgi:hypothetical protein